MTKIEWGDEIAADNDGVKLPWLDDEEHVMCHWSRNTSGGPYSVNYVSGWNEGFRVRLPADRWAYPVIAAGFVPWGGGDEAPGDAGEVMFRNGEVNPESPLYRWAHAGDGNHFAPECDIIGYKRKVAPGSEMWDRDLGNTPSPTDTVTIPTMTEEDAREKAEAHCEDYEWDNGYVQALRDLGLIRPATLLDQFEAHHGGLDDNQRAILEIYHEWIAAQ